jgi:tetratricopeptide (TPR) repeat protein
MAGQLVELARTGLRDKALPPELAAKEAALLLGWAQKLEEGAGAVDTATLRLLIEAARAAEKPAVEREALRKLIATDKGDLVAQVQYLDFLASHAQTVEDRTRIYANASEQGSLDPQVRSEMAMRLAQLAPERGDEAAERQYLQRALTLNDVNVSALRAQVRLSSGNPRAVPERLGALVALVTANPYEPEAWVEIGRICQEANLHDRAADALTVALEQMQRTGGSGGGELYLDWGMELAMAGRRKEAAAILAGLSTLPDAPLPVLLAAQLLSDVAPAGSTTAPAPVSERIEKAIGTMATDAEGGKAPPTAWADAAGVALTILTSGQNATTSAQAAGWIDAYAKTVPADDPTLQRLRGWQQYRAGQLDEARATLEKVADADPMAAIGLARVLIAQKKTPEATQQLQEVWSSHPSGLLGLQVAEAVRTGNFKLQETQWSRQLEGVAARIPQASYQAHRQPREVQLVNVTVDKVSTPPGEAMTASLRIMNTSGRALPVSAARTRTGGTVQTLAGLTADVRTPTEKALGLYALEDFGRVYRLEPRGTLEGKFRIDQGALAGTIADSPLQSTKAVLRVYTSPLVGADRSVVAGLGGQRIDVGDVTRAGFTLRSPEEFETFVTQVAGVKKSDSERGLAQIVAAGKVLDQLEVGVTYSPVLGKPEAARQKLGEALVPLARSGDALVRGTVALGAPGENAAVEKALEVLATDPEPLVRALWARHAATVAKGAAGTGRATAGDRLRQASAVEKDEGVREYMELLVREWGAGRGEEQGSTTEGTTRPG